MIYDKDDFEVKYWGGDFVPYNDGFIIPKTSRKIKRNILIFTSFLTFLILIPTIIFAISKYQTNDTKKIAVANDQIFENKKTVNQNTETYEKEIKTDDKTNKIIEIINNDSYWKISKRACGEGKYYLSIAQQNNNKALYKGETVTVSCKLN